MSTRTRQPATRQPGRRRQQPPRRPAWLWAAAVIAVVVALAGVVWTIASEGGDEDASSGTSVEDPGVEHVHGLGIDPATGALYVATHHGTFRLPDEGQAERVGDSFQDTMGFTVVGDRHFLGSGHPDVAGLREGQPTQLGLIQSTDAGKTWRPVSLAGETDFHALAYAHDRVYGWDATTGRFMVSADRRDWDTRSTLDLYGFAVDPADADHLIAATPGGLVASTDGGRRWSAQAGPSLVVLAWDRTSGLWGVDGQGLVHHSTGDGRSWQDAGSLPGPPQALLVTAGTLYAAADEDGTTGIYRSTDAGESWSLRYRDQP